MKASFSKAAEVMIEKLPMDYIQYIIDNPNYAIPMEKHVSAKDFGHTWGLGGRKMAEIENAAIDIRNSYYTGEIRKALINHLKKK